MSERRLSIMGGFYLTWDLSLCFRIDKETNYRQEASHDQRLSGITILPLKQFCDYIFEIYTFSVWFSF